MSSLLLNNLLKNLVFYLAVFSFCGVSGCHSKPIANQVVANECPTQPPGVLDTNNVKSIFNTGKYVKESGMISRHNSLGYVFNAEAGQKLKYQTASNLCIWVYAPDNQLLTTPIIPQTGRYIIQVSALQGAATFDLEMSLETVRASQNNVPHLSSTSTTISTRTSPVPVAQRTVSRPSPTQFIQDYYSNINNRQYQTGWKLLSPYFQKTYSENSYYSYSNWWDKILEVNVQYASLVEEGIEVATVDTMLSYEMKSGKFLKSHVRYYLTWNPTAKTWVFNDLKYLN